MPRDGYTGKLLHKEQKQCFKIIGPVYSLRIVAILTALLVVSRSR